MLGPSTKLEVDSPYDWSHETTRKPAQDATLGEGAPRERPAPAWSFNREWTLCWVSVALCFIMVIICLHTASNARDLAAHNDSIVVQRLAVLAKRVAVLEKRVAVLEKGVVVKQPVVVAFMAGITPHDPRGETKQAIYHGGDDIRFNQVHTNVGGWYSADSGRFSCRRRGLYQFSLSIRALDPNHMAWVEIVKDGVVFGRVHVNKLALRGDLVPDLGLSGSALFTTECEAGTEVWVRAGSWENFQGEMGFFCGLSDESYTSFGGILISVLDDGDEEEIRWMA